MIYYRPTDGDVLNTPIVLRPRTCFLMTKLGDSISNELKTMRSYVKRVLDSFEYSCIDADSITTGKDFLLKIWNMILGVPLGIAIIDNSITPQTMANIFYEMGWMQSMGKETIVIKSKDMVIPSDFVRTEYIEFNEGFERRFKSFLNGLDEHSDYFSLLANNLENNPLLAVDYYRRAFLITGDCIYQEKAKELLDKFDFGVRSKSSVEFLHFGFATGNQIIK